MCFFVYVCLFILNLIITHITSSFLPSLSPYHPPLPVTFLASLILVHTFLLSQWTIVSFFILNWKLLKEGILVFFCYITNHYSQSLKHLLFYSSVGQKTGFNWVICLWSYKTKINVLARLDPYLEALGKNFPNHSDFGSIQFLAVIKLRSPFPCWLSSCGCSEALKGIHIPYSMASSTFKPTVVCPLGISDFSSAISQKPHLMRLGLARLSLFCFNSESVD